LGIIEVCLDVKKSGMYIYTAQDKCIHLSATFSSGSFAEYDCEKECIFTLNIKSMKENLKNITSVDTIELTINREDRELMIKVIKKTIEFEKKVQIKETQYYNLPTVSDETYPLNIKSCDFLEFCRSVTGKQTMTIKTVQGIPEISFETDKSKVIIKSDADEEDIDILSFEGTFKTEYFSKLKKLAKFNIGLKIYTNPDQPLIFETHLASKEKDKVAVWIKSLQQMEEEYEEE
jgi:hypothetical protein